MRKQKQIHRSRRSPRPLVLEVLEDRCLLSYTITELGPSFLVNQHPHAINNLGQVLGLNFDLHVLMWDPATGIHDLGRGQGLAINDASQVLGWAQFGQSIAPALWDSDGTVTPIPVDPIALTETGQVIGSVGYFPNTRIKLWDPVNGVQDLGPLGSLGGQGFDDAISDANASGQVVGASDPPGDSLEHAFLWDSQNGMQDLGTLGPPSARLLSAANAINVAGQVVGGAEHTEGYFSIHAFVYDGRMHDLGTFGGDNSAAKGINDMGVGVGRAEVTFTQSHGFVYAGGVKTDLNNLIDPGSSLTIYDAYAINNAGWITADAQDAQGHRHSLVLTPDGGGSGASSDATGRAARSPLRPAAFAGTSNLPREDSSAAASPVALPSPPVSPDAPAPLIPARAVLPLPDRTSIDTIFAGTNEQGRRAAFFGPEHQQVAFPGAHRLSGLPTDNSPVDWSLFP
jgi:probable HAF family extracellular repeat protein